MLVLCVLAQIRIVWQAHYRHPDYPYESPRFREKNVR